MCLLPSSSCLAFHQTAAVPLGKSSFVCFVEVSDVLISSHGRDEKFWCCQLSVSGVNFSHIIDD